MTGKDRVRFDWNCGHWRDPWIMARFSCSECATRQRHLLDVLSAPAYRAVKKAIEAGILPALDGSIPCADCGKKAQQYDHRCYAKPLEVDPVCRSCNRRRGPAIEHVGLVRRPGAFTTRRVTRKAVT